MLKLRRAGAGVRHPRGGPSLTTAPPQTRARTRSRVLWYAVYHPGLSVQHTLPAALMVSDYVSAAETETLLIEIGGSLRYFGGWKRLRATLLQQLMALGHTHHLCGAVTPSPTASVLLARCGQQRVVTHSEDLRSAMANLAVNTLPLPPRLTAALQRCGLLQLRDLWRLPPAQLRLRFGRELSDYLNRLLALRPERPPRWQPPPHFECTFQPDYPLHNSAAICHHAAQLFTQYSDFLQRHHLLSGELCVTLYQEHAQPLCVPVVTRYASRDHTVFLALFELALEKLQLSADVTGLSLRSVELLPFTPDRQAQHLADILSARLGTGQVQRLQLAEEHAPEYAGFLQPWHMPPRLQADSRALPWQAPALLLQPPRKLRQLDNQLVYKTPLTLLAGPQRIETRWWAGAGIRRDYYVARNRQGSQLWIYRDLGQADTWYLHGIFS